MDLRRTVSPPVFHFHPPHHDFPFFSLSPIQLLNFRKEGGLDFLRHFRGNEPPDTQKMWNVIIIPFCRFWWGSNEISRNSSSCKEKFRISAAGFSTSPGEKVSASTKKEKLLGFLFVFFVVLLDSSIVSSFYVSTHRRLGPVEEHDNHSHL